MQVFKECKMLQVFHNWYFFIHIFLAFNFYFVCHITWICNIFFVYLFFIWLIVYIIIRTSARFCVIFPQFLLKIKRKFTCKILIYFWIIHDFLLLQIVAINKLMFNHTDNKTEEYTVSKIMFAHLMFLTC